MATGKRFYWIKLKDTFMTSDAVDFLMSQQNGANYVVLYQMLCLKTINTGGVLSRQLGEIIIPYDEEKIARDTKWFSVDTIRVALNLYKALGLIYEDADGHLALSNYDSLVGSESDWKDQKRAQRAKNLPKLEECKRLNANMLLLPTGKTQFVDEKRYGGNGMLAFDLAGGKCEMCGSYDDLCIHHANGYSNDTEDLFVLCKQCHGIAHSSDTPQSWLKHNSSHRRQMGGQVCGQVHIEKEKEIEKEKDNNKRVTRFSPPSVDDVSAYCKERKNRVDPQQFVDFYTAKGWKIGKDSMKDWKAAVRTWEKRDGRREERSNEWSDFK